MEENFKLNYKRTFYMGFAFFSILMLWQMYNYYCPIFLKTLLGDNKDYIIGIIMAADNILAIWMLPLFGALSDKTHTKWGKRMPYMVIGMIASAIIFPLVALMFYFNSLVGVITMMGVILIIMNIYRNPAVALMPDLTPKPLRSKANGIINLVGYIGAVLGGGIALVLGMLIKDEYIRAIVAFASASFFMIIAVIILIININEPKILEEMKPELERGELYSTSFTKENDKTLNKQDKINILILLICILFLFVSFNAVESFYSIFCKNVFENDASEFYTKIPVGTIIMAGLPLSSIITFLCAINLPTKIGRKLTVIIGIICMLVGFGTIVLEGLFIGYNAIIFLLCIIICGVGWALINANTYPMMVEVASSSNTGRYTGLYYTFSMLAQSITPIIAGLLITVKGKYDILFIYAFITMLIAFIIFLFFKERKVKIEAKKGFEAFEDND